MLKYQQFKGIKKSGAKRLGSWGETTRVCVCVCGGGGGGGGGGERPGIKFGAK